MRRSGSSSCMLRSRAESDGEPLSVTILNTQQLPKYSAERFYMLSEIEMHGNIVSFLSDYDCDQTTETEESSLTDSKSFAPYLILYLVWGDPQMSARVFAETVIHEALQKLDNLVDLVRTVETKRSKSVSNFESMRNSASNAHSGIGNTNNMAQPNEFRKASRRASSASLESDQATRSSTGDSLATKVYIVVDKVITMPANTPPEREQELFQAQAATAERLSRMVSSHSKMRHLCQGITVGVSNHPRAAPGLEACMDALMYGSTDRRRFAKTDDPKSWIGLVTLEQNNLLGLQQPSVTDAAQGVMQCRVCAEWNGRGTLQTFAHNVHSLWRTHHGAPIPQPISTRRSRLNLRRIRLQEQLETSIFDMLAASIAFVFWIVGAYYVWQNWRELFVRDGETAADL